MKVLFLGEGPGTFGYLNGVLQSAYDMVRVHGGQVLAETDVDVGDFPLVILSDYPCQHMSAAEQEKLVAAVERGGAGLLMIGGWSSFAGPRGSWHGSRVAEILPVALSPADDRQNTPLGTVLVCAGDHPATATVAREEPSCIVGFNRVATRPGAQVVIEGHALRVNPTRLEKLDTPMLALWERGNGRAAAFAPDVSPHWAGGIVDWGEQRVKLPNGAEIGHLYKAFLLDLCNWLVKA